MQKADIDREFLELFERYRRDLSCFSLALTRDREAAKDLVSDTILLAYENFHNLKKKESFKSYIFTIASRLQKRKNWRRRLFGVFSDSFAESIPDKSVNLERNIENELLYNAIYQLPVKQSEAIVLFELSGFSIAEICEIQGGTISGVKTRLKRAREKLGEILKKDIEYYHYESPSNVKEIEKSEVSIVL